MEMLFVFGALMLMVAVPVVRILKHKPVSDAEMRRRIEQE